MLPQPEGKRLQEELTAASIASGALPGREITVSGPGGSTREILQWEVLGTARITDIYPDGSYRTIYLPIQDEETRRGIGEIGATISSENVSIELPVFPQASLQDVRLRLQNETRIGYDPVTVQYDTTGAFTSASILVASSESPLDRERAGEELNVDQRFSLLLNTLRDLSPEQRKEMEKMSEDDFNISTESIEGFKTIPNEANIFQQEIVPAIIETMIKIITQDPTEQKNFKEVLGEVGFTRVFTGRLLEWLKTEEMIKKWATFWKEEISTQNLGKGWLEHLEDLAIVVKDHDMRADLTKMDPIQEGQSLKAILLAGYSATAFQRAIDDIMSSYNIRYNSEEEQRIALEVNQQGSLTYQVYSLSTEGIEEKRSNKESGILGEGTTVIPVMDKNVAIEIAGETMTIRWIPQNRRDKTPIRTASFQKQIPIQQILEGATNVNAPVPEVIALLGASISNS